MGVNATIQSIRDLQVQGAENIARAALAMIKNQVSESKTDSPLELLERLQAARQTLVTSYPQETCMRHALTYIFYHLQDGNIVEVTKELCERIDAIQSFLNRSDDVIADHATSLISDGDVVVTHSYSSTVLHALKKARDKGIQFSVALTETRPYYLGRDMADALAQEKIPVTLYVDSHAHRALKNADIFLMGCDALTDEEIVGTEGCEMMALLSAYNHVPTYCLSNSWKFDPSGIAHVAVAKERSPDDVWDDAPPGVTIHNNFYDAVQKELATSIVSDLGIYHHDDFVDKCLRKYPWLKLSKK